MYPIPEPIKTLLKSGIMIGNDSPAFNIEWEGFPASGNIDWNTLSGQYRISTTEEYWCTSAVVLRDGRVLVVYTKPNSTTPLATGTVYRAYSSNLQTFLFSNDSTTGETAIFSNYVRPRATVFWAPDGNLYLILIYLKDDLGNNLPTVKLYKDTSENKDGSNFTPVTTVQQITNWPGVYSYASAWRAAPGRPYFLSNGRWVIPGVKFYNYSNYITTRNTIWTSDDNGLTWTERYSFGIGAASQNGEAHPARNIALFQNTLIWVVGSNYSTEVAWWTTSTDGGNTWSTKYQLTGTLPDGTSSNWIDPGLYADETYLYYFHGYYTSAQGNYAKIAKSSVVPTSWSHFSNFKDLPTPWGVDTGWDSHMIITKEDNKLVCIAGAGPQYANKSRVISASFIEASPFNIRSISINKDQRMAATATIVVDNKDGTANPFTSQYQGVLWPNRQVKISLGYGSSLVKVFTGMIDSVRLRSFPQEIEVSIRDMAKRALDQTITNPSGKRAVKFTNQTPEAIFTTLAQWAGWSAANIHTETSGIAIPSIEFCWETYADAFNKLAEPINFEWWTDREGDIHFRYATDRQPAVINETKTLTGTDWVNLNHDHIVPESDIVTGVGGTPVYSRTTDYEIDYTLGRIRRRSGSSIPDPGTVEIDYVYAAWIFREGEDIMEISLELSDDEIANKVFVFGKEANSNVALYASSNFSAANYWLLNKIPHKVMRVDMSELNSVTLCQKAADRLTYLMKAKPIIATFKTIGHPWLQIGDCIQIIESSTTISEIYRITNLSYNFDSSGFTTEITAYHYGYAPIS